MTILITGATGLVGSKLIASLKKDKHTIHYLSTSKTKLKNNLNYKGFYWNPATREIDVKALDGVSVIIHLAGASISKRWTKAYKKEIIASRVAGANLISDTLKTIPNKVTQFISASAVGIYPNNLNSVYSENTVEIDNSFLGEVTQLWEASANQFQTLSISVSIVRIGVVFAKESGALVEMTKPIKFGLGAVLSTGNQYVSWIHVDDLVAMFVFILNNKLFGVYNAVSPHPITNLNVTKAIAKTINRPLFLPKVPKFILNFILGKMHIIVTNSQNVSCLKILNAGFQFQFASLNKTLQHLLK